MLAVDTNILVYAHRRDAPWHSVALKRVRELAEGQEPWIIAYHCLIEFYAIVTHPRIYLPPSKPDQAVCQIRAWLGSPSLLIAHSSPQTLDEFLVLAVKVDARGGQAHDVRIISDALASGARLLWSSDRDLSRIKELEVTNPLL